MAKVSSSQVLMGAAALVAILLVGYAVKNGRAPVTGPVAEFAQCLTDKGVKMYGAWWCPHCSQQKALFGPAFKNVTYVECSDANKQMMQVCKDAGVEGYPTWKFADGSVLNGEQTFASLGRKADCAVPAAE